MLLKLKMIGGKMLVHLHEVLGFQTLMDACINVYSVHVH
jgi:hypothetical protein